MSDTPTIVDAMDELNEDDTDGDDMALQKDVKSLAVGGGIVCM